MSHRLFRRVVTLMVCAGVVLVCAAQAVPAGYTVGVPWVGEAGVRERTSDILKREAFRFPARHAYRIHKHGTVELVEYAEGAGSPAGPQAGAGSEAAGGAAQTVGTNFLGATLLDCQAYPPDTMGAAGPTQFIIALNGRIRSFNKTAGSADGAINVDTDAFFNSVMTPPTSNNFTSDPRIRYDRLSQRWFIIMIDVPGKAGTSPDRIMIAMSDGPIVTLNTVWTFYQFRHDLASPAGDSNKFADYPTLGIDVNALYIGVNVFGTRGLGTFSDTTAFVVRKSSLLSGGPIVVTAFRNLLVKVQGVDVGPYTPQGVDNYDPAATEGYFIGVDSGYYGRLMLRRVSNPGGTPAISGNIAISLPVINGGTINVPHLGNTGGTAGELDGLDYRLMAAHLRNGRLWTSANTAVDNAGVAHGSQTSLDSRMGVRWYELQGIATGQTPSFVQYGTFFEPSPANTTTNRCYWMGTVMVSGQGHMAMGFSVAGANERVNAGTAGRLKNDPPGTMRSPILYTASSTAYNPLDSNNNPINRWGDYSYTCLDPNDDMTMWTIQEFCNANNSYGVQIAKLLAPPPATPAACSPSTLTQGVANASVTLTGTTDGDTGFFDPGAGFSNRIAAAISGTGVTVNSVTYNNPTNLTLSLSVAGGAVTGSRNVTVTNPDGQSVTSTGGILTIGAGVATNHSPSLPAISTKTVNELQMLTFTNSASDSDGNALTYSLQNAPTNAAIGATNGVFTWTPTEAQGPGSNYIRVVVTDNGSPSLSATQIFAAIVNEVNSAPLLTGISNKTVTEGSSLTFTNSASDPDLPANTFTYSLANAPTNATVNPATGVFAWTPNEAQGPGTNMISVIVTDNGVPSLTATQNFTVVVLETNVAPVLSTITDRTVHAGGMLRFTNSATDPDIPANGLTFSLDAGSPAGANIDTTNGVFTWTPGDVDANTTNSITVRVTDDGVPPLDDAQTFLVSVVSRPVITGIGISNSAVTVTWSALAGQVYRLQYLTNVDDTNWNDVPPDVTASGLSASQTDPSALDAQRFYRVMLVP